MSYKGSRKRNNIGMLYHSLMDISDEDYFMLSTFRKLELKKFVWVRCFLNKLDAHKIEKIFIEKYNLQIKIKNERTFVDINVQRLKKND